MHHRPEEKAEAMYRRCFFLSACMKMRPQPCVWSQISPAKWETWSWSRIVFVLFEEYYNWKKDVFTVPSRWALWNRESTVSKWLFFL